MSYSRYIVLINEVLELLVSNDLGVGNLDIEGIPRLEIRAL